MFFLYIHLYAIFSFVTAQDFMPSSSWKNPTITLSQGDRVAIARDGIQQTIAALGNNGQFDDSFYGTPGRFYSQMAEYDLATNQSTYKDQLLQYFAKAQVVQAGFLNELSIMDCEIKIRTYSIAATRAYAAYRDPAFLTFAEIAWGSGREYTLSDDNIRTGSIPGKNFTIEENCERNSMAGGCFWRRDPTVPDLNGLSTGSFLVASALLAEATPNDTYRDAAMQTATFLSDHFVNRADGLIQDTIDAHTCAPSQEIAHSYNSGLTIEGLAVLSSVTGDSRITQLLHQLVLSTVTSKSWQDADGIIKMDAAELGGQYVVRGLAAIYNRNSTPSDLRTYIESYLAVQYNAVLNNAREPQSNVYGASWVGPPSPTFSSENQTNALSVLIAGISLSNDTRASGGGGGEPTPSPAPTDHPSKGPNIGAIAGGVVGGFATIALIVAFVLFLIRRKARNTSNFLEGSQAQTDIAPPSRDDEPESHYRSTSAKGTDTVRNCARCSCNLCLFGHFRKSVYH
ncbi:hypothetical protein VNI00_013907 [Paramarasmius palmivorus]|uniref:Glycoside hydrolase family 76 protein n=1 Tax=Paramarasmius palmivorus TaxID=297713 RepID=A0AAW0BVZ6_9AGAR